MTRPIPPEVQANLRSERPTLTIERTIATLLEACEMLSTDEGVDPSEGLSAQELAVIAIALSRAHTVLAKAHARCARYR